jgi:hypothetical protein
MDGDKPKKQRFKRYPIGFFHIDIAELRTAEGKLYLFVAIDRTSKFAVAQLGREGRQEDGLGVPGASLGRRALPHPHDPHRQRHPVRGATPKPKHHHLSANAISFST